jgi:predicted ATPase/transcriptional regulator with XRE-family HTH domain
VPDPDDTAFAALLRRHRLVAGLTQEALAERAGLSSKAVSDLERDPDRTPRLETVTLLANALGLDPQRRGELLAAARPEALDPAPARVRPRPSLPRPLTPLIGRAGVVAAVTDILRRGDLQLMTLTGPGGVGKTRLAIEVAGRLTDEFADGVVFVDLAPLRDPGLVPATVARRLGLGERDATPLQDRLIASLWGRHLLLLLDNFEHVMEARAWMLTLAEACPGLVLLVTSRVAPNVRGGREYRIAPLSVPEAAESPDTLVHSPAVELFLERARAGGTELELDDQTASAVAEICRRLEGLPLAIELAAARLRLLPLPTLLSRLDRYLPLLVAGPHDLPDRQRTMRDTITWSYELLDRPQQALLARLCVFVGGCTLDAAEAVCQRAGERVLDRLATLVDSNLVRLDESPPSEQTGDPASWPRVTLLEPIREYGLERIDAREQAETAARHAAYYLGLAEDARAGLAGPNAGVCLARLERERGNLRAALGWAVRSDPATAAQLAAALAGFWGQRGYLTEGRRWLREALERSEGKDSIPASVQARARVGAARLALQQAAYEDAETRCAQAVALSEEHDDPQGLAAALNTRGWLAREQDRYDEAVEDHEQALALARAVADQTEETAALLGLAYAAMLTGEAGRARTLLEDSLAVARDLGDQRAMADAGFLLTWLAISAADYEGAEALGAETLALYRRLGDTGQTAEVLFALGNVAQFRGESDRATMRYEQCLALHRDRGDEHHTARSQAALGLAALHTGDQARARTLLEASLALERRYEDRWGQAMSLTLLGHVELAAGNHERAGELLGEAALLFLAIGNPMYLPWCLEALAGLAAAGGRHIQAAELDGAREGVRLHGGMLLPPAYPAGYERTVTAVRDALGDEAFEVARTTGLRQPLNETIRRAVTAT